MNEETAKTIINAMTAFDPLIGALAAAIENVAEEDLRNQFKKATGDVMGMLFAEIMYPLERLYPNLIPKNER